MAGEEDAVGGSMKRLDSVVDLVEIAGTLKASTVLIAGGHRNEDLRLVESARDHGIIDRIILVGRGDLVTSAVREVGIDIAGEDIVSADTDEEIASRTVQLIQSGSIDVVLKGGISTPIINRHIIKLAVRPTVSLATIVEASPVAEGRPLIITDAGVTTICNFGRMVNLIENAVEVARVVMGLERPRVAVLSANEKQIPSLPSTWIGRSLAQRSWTHALVSGPLSFDLATDPESVSVKGLPDIPHARDVAGKADILVCPGIDAANILYKTFTAMTKFGQASMAGVTVGFPVPYIILSRADPLETRLLSIALCSIYAQRKVDRGEHQEAEGSKVREHTHVGEVAPVKSRSDGEYADSRGEAEGMTLNGHKKNRILVINPGSTSIKLALYTGKTPSHDLEIPRSPPRLSSREAVLEECGAVVDLVLETLAGWSAGVDAIAARGGFIRRPAGKLSSGTYIVAECKKGGIEVERNLVEAIIENPEMEHASNLGIPVASELAQRLKVPAYVVDPVIVDEFRPEAELSGYAPIRRVSIGHALSVHAAAREAAQQIGRPLQDVNLVVAHLGGGITVAAVRGGRVVDSNIALLGEGPFTPQRAGTLPLSGIIDLCYSGRFSREELSEELSTRGGIFSYLGEYRMEALQDRVRAGDEQVKLVIDAMVYRIAREIGSMYMALECDVEAVVLTGGLTRSPLVRLPLRKRVARLAPVFVFEGSLEMEALARGVSEVLLGRMKPQRFPLEGA
jgi:butyrate kinase